MVFFSDTICDKNIFGFRKKLIPYFKAPIKFGVLGSQRGNKHGSEPGLGLDIIFSNIKNIRKLVPWTLKFEMIEIEVEHF